MAKKIKEQFDAVDTSENLVDFDFTGETEFAFEMEDDGEFFTLELDSEDED